MDILLRLRRAPPAVLAVALAIGGPGPGVHLDIRRPIQPPLGVVLALGADDSVPTPEPAPDYRAAGRLAIFPGTLRASAGEEYAAAGRLVGRSPILRGAADEEAQPYAAVGRLRGKAPTLRAYQSAPDYGVRHSSGGAWGYPPLKYGEGWTFPWQRATVVEKPVTIPWGKFQWLNVLVDTSWKLGIYRDLAATVRWDHFEHLNVDVEAPWVLLHKKDVEEGSGWGRLRWTDVASSASWKVPPFKDRAWGISYKQLATYLKDRSALIPYFYPPTKDVRRQTFPWGLGQPAEYRVRYELPPVAEVPPHLPAGSYVCIDLHRPLDADSRNVSLRLRRPLRTYCDTGTFIVNNSLNVITLIDGANLECTAVSMKLDINSFAWDISLTLATSAEFVRVKPSPAQDGAREIQITCNGYVWRGFVDTVSLSREFGNPSYTAQGKSFSAYGAAPFAPLTSRVSEADELTQQLANDVFQYTGFTITWDAVDWVVPAGLLAYENKDPMGVVSQICAAGGMFILPGRYDKSFTVRSRYPVTIWHWDNPATETDAHIPLNQMISGSSRYEAGIEYTKVYVSGTQIGNTVGCTRDGTDGASQSPAVVDALLATDEAATERGRVELCRGGSRIFNSYVTPLVSATASGVRLREVGELVAVDEAELDDAAYNGLITSVQVVAARTGPGELTVYQTLEIERHV